TTLPLELPQVKPKRNDEGKGRGMQFKGPQGKGSVSELKSAGSPVYPGQDSPRPGPPQGSRKPASPLQLAADHLEEELDLLLSLDAPVKGGGNISPDQASQSLDSEKDGDVAQEEKAPANPSVTEEKVVEAEQLILSRVGGSSLPIIAERSPRPTSGPCFKLASFSGWNPKRSDMMSAPPFSPLGKCISPAVTPGSVPSARSASTASSWMPNWVGSGMSPRILVTLMFFAPSTRPPPNTVFQRI
ncbi:hypothetical protein MC885_014826, partial [Smutsia gigantea]